MSMIKGFHHLTAGVSGAQGGRGFLCQGSGPEPREEDRAARDGRKIRSTHLYYGNANGGPGTLVTSLFPFRQKGVKARPGSGQVRVINLLGPRGVARILALPLPGHERLA
ncbi:hypothetical protein ACTMU2_26845 [Cupriavidus basilensis]